MSSKPDFIFDSEGRLCNQKCFIIDSRDKFLLGYLNSTLMKFLYACHMPELQGGFYEPGCFFLERMPFPKVVDQKARNAIELLVDRISNEPSNLSISKKIDEKIYKMFGLTNDEILSLEWLANNYRTERFYQDNLKKSA
jgi:hypothetical protein